MTRTRFTTQPPFEPASPLGNDALLLIAHGSARYGDADQILQGHAAALRERGCFAEVGVGFLSHPPTATEALASLSTRMVHVVPFFMEQGWFVNEAIPRALRNAAGRHLQYHLPVGLHPALPGIAAQRVRRACGAEAANHVVLLVGHGSARAPGRAMALYRHMAVLAATGGFADARAAFLEEPPLVADALCELRARPVAVIGFFAGDGRHVREDLPALLASERRQRGNDGAPVLDLGMIGDDPAMPQIIIEHAAIPGSGGPARAGMANSAAPPVMARPAGPKQSPA